MRSVASSGGLPPADRKRFEEAAGTLGFSRVRSSSESGASVPIRRNCSIASSVVLPCDEVTKNLLHFAGQAGLVIPMLLVAHPANFVLEDVGEIEIEIGGIGVQRDALARSNSMPRRTQPQRSAGTCVPRQCSRPCSTLETPTLSGIVAGVW